MSTERCAEAYRVVFGARLVTDEVLRRLTLAELKRSYRTLAMQLHPDRASAQGASESEMTRRFQRVNAAYDVLKKMIAETPRAPHLHERPVHRSPPPPAPTTHTAPPRPASRAVGGQDPYWRAPVPKRRLLFAEHLYYSGRISWQQLIDALVWQARERPRFGNLAVQYGFLTVTTIRDLMSARHSTERIGECAVRVGYMRETQRDFIMALQKVRSRRVGAYFVENSILDLHDVARAAVEQQRHNAAVAA
jgi:hypothetical protein